MILCSLIEELCTKEENDKTGCYFNFGHECANSLNDIKLYNKSRLIRVDTLRTYIRKEQQI